MQRQLPLTDAERLILANQYQILSRLEKLESGRENDEYEQLADQLLNGYDFLYQGFIGQIVSDVLSPEQTQHVLDTLNLFSALKASYDNLEPALQEEIDKRDVTFQGFDGNNETEELLFAEALEKAGRYSITLRSVEDLNSHFPTNDIYRRMIQVWEELGYPHYPMSVDQIKRIAEARVHPSNR